MWKLSLQALRNFGAFLGKAVTAPLALFKKSKGVAKYFLWAIHLGVVAGITVLLYFVGMWTELDLAVRVPSQILRTGWLSLLFLLAYSLVWLGWTVWRVSHKLTQASSFPDIDAAWESGLNALQNRGINIQRTPLYLVLGKPQSGANNWLAASGFPLEVTPTPEYSDAPLQISGNRDAIFVHCTNSSLLSRQAASFSAVATNVGRDKIHTASAGNTNPLQAPSEDALEADFLASADLEWPAADEQSDWENGSPLGSHSAGGTALAAPPKSTATTGTEVSARVEQATQTVGLLIEEHEELEAEDAVEELDHYREALVTRQDEIDELAARVRHIATLIRDQREPLAGVNGVLALIPVEATRNEHQAQHVAMLAHRELEEVCDALELQCPVLGVICDLEQLPGCKELLHHFPTTQRERRFGMRLPSFSQADWKTVPKMLEQSVQWVCEQLAPALAYRIAARTGQTEKPISAKGGSAIFHFLAELRRRAPGLERLLNRGLCPDLQSRKGWHFAGWYFAATGRDATNEQAFLPGVTTQLADLQNSLAWTENARQLDRKLRRYALLGYVAIGLTAVTCGALIIHFASQW
jgi:FtsZ-binding cell division protein ZapB